MQIFVKTLTGRSITVIVDEPGTVDSTPIRVGPRQADGSFKWVTIHHDPDEYETPMVIIYDVVEAYKKTTITPR